MTVHPAYLRCLGLTEALKVLCRMRRFDDHYEHLLVTFDVKMKELDGIVLEPKHKARIESSKLAVETCKQVFHQFNT